MPNFLTIQKGRGRPNFCWWFARSVLPQVSLRRGPCSHLPATLEKLPASSGPKLEQRTPVIPELCRVKLELGIREDWLGVEATKFRVGREFANQRDSLSPYSHFDMTKSFPSVWAFRALKY